ncbi:MAG: hypothetical protein MUF49_18095 [Oculatellaceae cyanobacterium Prado106]|jgi:hypothetical protein|nr:hypothetical protein [Oculatellaceae cyanobacterium Prado106]
MDDALIQEINRLRELKLPPKQIARQLGLRPAEVTTIIKAKATEISQERQAKGELPPIAECLINENAARYLLDTRTAQDRRQMLKTLDADGVGGLGQVVVTRLDRNQYIACSYLIDYWCLGVKDALGPRKFDRFKYDAFSKKVFERFTQSVREITLEEAQSIIFGVIDYAASLGFQPHADFEQAQINLGSRPKTLLPIEFGKDGKPFYISGPYDNPDRIIRTLEKHVGQGNFDYLLPINLPPGF